MQDYQNKVSNHKYLPERKSPRGIAAGTLVHLIRASLFDFDLKGHLFPGAGMILISGSIDPD